MAEDTFLRSQFDYKTTVDSQLSFSIGDILKTVKHKNNNDKWNYAQNLRSGGEGFIPISKFTEAEFVEVKRVDVPYVQPVVLLGSMKNPVQDYLAQTHSQQFACCVPHTTRNRRENEVDGIDYFFVKDSTMRTMLRNGLFVDCGEYGGNLYGTSEAAVRMVAQRQKKHCILDALTSLQKLIMCRMYPIVLFVGAQSYRSLMQMRFAGHESEFEARDAIIADNELLSRKPNVFQGVIQASTLDDLYSRVIATVAWIDSTGPWVPVSALSARERLL